MKVLFDKKFLRDIGGLSDRKLKSRIEKIITEVEACRSWSEFGNVKKMKGHSSAYRIRVGAYRIGIFKEAQVVKFVCLLHRKEIYRYFP